MDGAVLLELFVGEMKKPPKYWLLKRWQAACGVGFLKKRTELSNSMKQTFIEHLLYVCHEVRIRGYIDITGYNRSYYMLVHWNWSPPLPLFQSSFFLTLIFIKLKAKSAAGRRRYSRELSGRTESLSKFAASFHLDMLSLPVLQYLWPRSHIMFLLFSLSSYPVQLCLLAIMQPTQVEFSLDFSSSDINWKTATPAMAHCTHSVHSYLNGLSQRGQLVFTDNLKTKPLQGYEKGLLWKYSKEECMGEKKNGKGILLFSGNLKKK